MQNYSSGSCPATYQGTLFRKGDTPILNLKPPAGTTDAQQRSKLDFLQELNERYGRDKQDDTELDARTRSYELAYQMQSAAPEAVDLTKRVEATKKLYGMDEPETAVYGTNCLLARRWSSAACASSNFIPAPARGWDAHQDLEAEPHQVVPGFRQAGRRPARRSESPRHAEGHAGGLGRRIRPHSVLIIAGQSDKYGRDHNPWGFTMWMAGGGVKGGQTIGTTDEIGLRAVDEPHHVHDIHASILHLLGLDHLRTTYMHNGRAERPTVTGGNLITKLWT